MTEIVLHLDSKWVDTLRKANRHLTNCELLENLTLEDMIKDAVGEMLAAYEEGIGKCPTCKGRG